MDRLGPDSQTDRIEFALPTRSTGCLTTGVWGGRVSLIRAIPGSLSHVGGATRDVSTLSGPVRFRAVGHEGRLPLPSRSVFEEIPDQCVDLVIRQW